jgi:two-component system nitrogen regulation sensor histidine kinase NtrY
MSSAPRTVPFFRDLRFLVGAVLLLLVLSTTFYALILRARDLPVWLAANRVLVFVLWYANITFLLVLAFIILRQSVKLILERRRRLLGFRLRTKLVLSMMALVLVPIIYLFIVASDLVVRASDLPPDLPRVLAGGRDLIADWDRARVAGVSVRARELRGLLESAPVGEWYRVLEGFTAAGAPIAEVYEDRRLLVALSRVPEVSPQAARLPGDFLTEVERSGASFLWTEQRGAWVLRAGVAMALKGRAYQVVAGEVPPPALARARADYLASAQSLSQVALQKGLLDTTRTLTLLLLTLSVAFAGMWMGTYLSRHFTHPLRQLLDATRRIRQGDLTVRLEAPAMDEWGVLFADFNVMAEELQRYRALLAEEREYLSSLVAHVTHGLASFEPGGALLTANPAARRMLRLPEGETDLYAALERSCPALLAVLRGAVDAGREIRGEALDLTLQEGMQVSLSAVRLPGGRWLLVVEDVTGLVRIQKQATWKEAAQRVAHEIKNPLTPIRLMAERLKRKLAAGEPAPPDVQGSLDTILEEVDNLKSMLDAFSQFARMPLPNPQPFDLRETFAHLEEVYRGLHPSLRFAFAVAEGFPPLRADRELVRRALVNLLDNAAEACRMEGEVRVGASVEGRWAVLRVADTGPGVPDERKERIFQPYVSNKGRGSGMGLSIVDRIARDHGGSVRVSDNDPRGAVFTLLLPL